MQYLDKTKVIVDDIVKMVGKIEKATDSRTISNLERECVKAIQIAQMQFGYVTRDLQAAVSARRVALQQEQRNRIAKAISSVKENDTPKAEKPATKKKTKKGK